MDVVYIICVNSSLKNNEIIYEKLTIPTCKKNDSKYIAYLWSLQYGLYTEATGNIFITQYKNNGKFIIVHDIDNYSMNNLICTLTV